jgi:hypothetical protein
MAPWTPVKLHGVRLSVLIAVYTERTVAELWISGVRAAPLPGEMDRGLIVYGAQQGEKIDR